jgi:hypothetical protein
LALNRGCIKVRVAEKLKDPVKRALQRTEEERSILADKDAVSALGLEEGAGV